jgi:2-polyprenyl-3-methyl-5-hydroxy-6-metoxy-1,4-benzoquinol methylase
MNNVSSAPPPAAAPPICPVSHSAQSIPLCTVDGFTVWRCPESAVDFVWPPPDSRTLQQLYDREDWFESGERGGYADYDVQTAPSLPLVSEILSRYEQTDQTAGKELAILDVGCGYGNHLALAAQQGWKCFGIEPSLHARSMAQQRLAEQATIVATAEDLLPKRFDVVLMLEVIEHLSDPYHLFFTLFGKNVIGPETLVVLSTPNARSADAIATPATWAYRHPPSHLVFYSAKALQALFQKLLFKHIDIRGIVAQESKAAASYSDEAASINDGLGNFLGLLVEAKASDFKEFMHERYVPGAYWKLTEYEHFPRYTMAAQFAKDAKALDFGCGTGYGTAMLSRHASSVVGLDIASDAIEWARATHRHPNIQFDLRSDLGHGLEQSTFDLVTCFEMIEHVDHAMQIATVTSIASLLKPSGKLVISTPDPAFTAPYGHNPYHLREMNEAQFKELLHSAFKHVVLLKQWVRPSIMLAEQSIPGQTLTHFGSVSEQPPTDAPVGFVAICSNQPIAPISPTCLFDVAIDFNRSVLDTEQHANRLRFANYEQTEVIKDLKKSLLWMESLSKSWEVSASEKDRQIETAHADFHHQLVEAHSQIALRDSQNAELQSANQWHASQSQSWQDLAAQHGQTITTLDAQNAELQSAAQWHASQSHSWQDLAAQHGQTITTLDAQNAELHSAKQWHASQSQSWQELSAQHGQTIRTLEITNQTLAHQLQQHETTLDTIRKHWAMRLVNRVFKKRFF